MAGETSTAVTRPNRRAAASANCPVPVPRSTTVESAPRPCAARASRSSAGSGIPLLAVEAGHEGRVEVLGSRVRQFVDHP